MVRKERRSPIDWEEALRLHDEESWSMAEIAEEFGYAYKTVQAGLRHRGARRPKPALRGALARKLRTLWGYHRDKCRLPSHSAYSRFGARGIQFSEEWDDFEAFYSWAQSSGYRIGLHLNRIDASGPYSPANCQWLTEREYRLARRLSEPKGADRKAPTRIDWKAARRLHAEGLTKAEIARRLGVTLSPISKGLDRTAVQRTNTRALTTPHEHDRLRALWNSLHRRCTSPREHYYVHNGAHGIRVDEAWREFEPFLRWSLSAGRKPGLHLCRIELSKNYGPDNCEWVTRQEAGRRIRPPPPRSHRLIYAFGELKGVLDWEKDPRCTMSEQGLRNRLAAGWPPERAISEPPQNRSRKDAIEVEVRAFGQTKGLTHWTLDPRCRIGVLGLQNRLRDGWTSEEAITTPPYQRPARMLNAKAATQRAKSKR